MKCRRKYVLIFAAVILALLLMCANTIAVSFVPEDRLMSEYNFDKANENGEIYAAITDLQYAQDTFETLLISGWTAHLNANDTLKARVILKGEKRSYASVPCELKLKKQVNRLFNTQANSAFNIYVSTLNMKNGNYDVYVETSCEDKVLALSYMGRSIYKKGTQIKNVSVAEKVNDITACIDDRLDCAVQPVTENEAGLTVIGWCKMPGTDSRLSNIYARVQQGDSIKFFKLYCANSTEIALNNDGLSSIQSGFNSAIPKSELTNEIAHISLILENNGQYYSSKEVGGFDFANN
ncbi:MAG: hypothetical protein RR424_05880 [Oscillospiraceae bacterium]